MKRKLETTVAVITKVREFYTTKKVLGLIKVDRLARSEQFGDEVHVYYEDINKFDRVFVNGIEVKPVEKNENE